MDGREVSWWELRVQLRALKIAIALRTLGTICGSCSSTLYRIPAGTTIQPSTTALRPSLYRLLYKGDDTILEKLLKRMQTDTSEIRKWKIMRFGKQDGTYHLVWYR